MPEERYDDLVPQPPMRARAPSPGLAAVLSVVIPGLGHVYAGRLGAGLLWFLAAGFGYWAILVPGFLIHVASVWFAYQAAKDFRGY
jgi:TM2 domain-containing membrane protein YozV